MNKKKLAWHPRIEEQNLILINTYRGPELKQEEWAETDVKNKTKYY